MAQTVKQPTLGLALSGSGNRTAFYIGFLEVFEESGINIHFITATSGASLVAAAFACKALPALKKIILALNKDNIKQYFAKSLSRGGLFSLDLVEEELKNLIHGQHFEDTRPLMSFVGVDIESGELVDMCMGDISRAARISCTLPGIFEPVKWGSRTLVDGGLLSQVPLESLKKFSPDICIGVNMRGTKHIFTESQMNLKRAFNFFKKILFLEQLGLLVNGFFSTTDTGEDLEKNPKLLDVLGKSLDLAIKANKEKKLPDSNCDLLITPTIPKFKRDELSEESMRHYYELGRKTAVEYLPAIKQIIKKKSETIYVGV